MTAPGAHQWVMQNTKILQECLTVYRTQHGISPNPRVLMQAAGGELAADIGAEQDIKGDEDYDNVGDLELGG